MSAARVNPQNYRKLNWEDSEIIEMANDGYPKNTEMKQFMKNSIIMELMDVEDNTDLDVQVDILLKGRLKKVDTK